MDAGRRHRLGEKERQYFGEGAAGIRHADERFLFRRERLVHDDGRGGALLGAFEESFVLGEGEVASLGLVGRGERGEDEAGVAYDFAA